MGAVIIGPLRALCDTGSQVNLISEAAVRAHCLPTKQCSVRIAGINATTKQPFTRKVVGKLLSRLQDEAIIEIELLVMPGKAISQLPTQPLPMELVPEKDVVRLADPNFNVPTTVDILLGAGVWAACASTQNELSSTGIIMQESRLGLLLFGGDSNHSANAAVNHVLFDTSDEGLSSKLQQFWELEELPQARTRTNEQQQCEEFFVESHRRMSNGQYVVGIPLRSDIAHLGSSREIDFINWSDDSHGIQNCGTDIALV